MKKIELFKEELIINEIDFKKWSTNVNNVYIYEIQNGWGLTQQIFDNQRRSDSALYIQGDCFKQKSIIIAFDYFLNGELCGKKTTYYSRGTKKYIIQ